MSGLVLYSLQEMQAASGSLCKSFFEFFFGGFGGIFESPMYLKLKIHPQYPHICVPGVFLFAVVGREGGALFDV